MAIVKLNTLDRTLILNNENSSEEFITHSNIYGKFIFIDAKYDYLFSIPLFFTSCFKEPVNILVIVHLN